MSLGAVCVSVRLEQRLPHVPTWRTHPQTHEPNYWWTTALNETDSHSVCWGCPTTWSWHDPTFDLPGGRHRHRHRPACTCWQGKGHRASTAWTWSVSARHVTKWWQGEKLGEVHGHSIGEVSRFPTGKPLFKEMVDNRRQMCVLWCKTPLRMCSHWAAVGTQEARSPS